MPAVGVANVTRVVFVVVCCTAAEVVTSRPEALTIVMAGYPKPVCDLPD